MELQERDQWVQKNLKAVREVQAETPALRQKPESGLFVTANHDPVQKNSRGGKPMKLGTTEYTRGLYCHATSRIVVRLPRPGRTFDAMIGVDHNENTQAGGGSVHFFIQVGEKEVFRSDLIRGGKAGVPVHVDLAGATGFALCVDDGGDGISCDQADWADAKATLDNGETIWLADLPILVGESQPLSSRSVFQPPFSFVYGGRSSDALLDSWQLNETSKRLDEDRTQRTQVYKDPQTGLVVRCEIVEYHDFPTVEWTLHFKNTGSADTPILESIQSLDAQLERTGSGEFLLHHFVGSPCTAYDYQPQETVLKPDTTKRITTAGGRSTNSDLPYFNLETGDGKGVIVAVGWPGQWVARFVRDAKTHLRLAAGQELTHLVLHPGEEIRTPMTVLQFYRGDWIDGQNTWRRWMWTHNLPRPGGRVPAPQMAACSSHQYGEMINADEASQKMFIDRYLGEGLSLDYWWMDAGWYWNKHGWPHVGTWEVDTNRFPNGLQAISDYAHNRGVRTIVWFEPERVAADTWLTNTHPEWVHGGAAGGLLKLGEPAVLEWATNHIDGLIESQGVDLYRQDFNMDPLDSWRAADQPDRQGIAEIRHVTNYLAYWDELRRRHPNMLIDSCASGGRRNDLETLRRAVPLLRSDFLLEPVSQQNHTYGIAFWMPFYGTGINQFDAYSLRSCLCPHITACYDMRRRDQDYDPIRRMLRQWRQEMAPNYRGDYYPLTPYSMDDNVWAAWQFNRPESGQGMVQGFRRPKCEEKAVVVRLRGLDPQARYRLANIDTDRTWTLPARELLEQGLHVETDKQPNAVVITYERIN